MTRLETKATLPRQELERLWEEHLKGEFETKDVEATLATMVDDAQVNHMPVNTGGRGKDALRAFYRDDFIPAWPDDLQMTPVNRVVGDRTPQRRSAGLDGGPRDAGPAGRRLSPPDG